MTNQANAATVERRQKTQLTRVERLTDVIYAIVTWIDSPTRLRTGQRK